jgi:tetratricopeptide (TPR) repeat protein
MTLTEARRLLHKAGEDSRDWIGAKCCRFVFGPLRTAAVRLDRKGASTRDRRLASNGYRNLGDFFDMVVQAPRAAARAYRAAVRCDPRDTWSWAELAHMLINMGQYRAALRALRTASQFGLKSELCSEYLEWATEALRDRDRAWYRRGAMGCSPAPSWDACELLARNRPRETLRLLRRKRHPVLRKLRARAHGLVGNSERLIEEWEGMASIKGEVAVELADWFFLPEEVWDTPRFWRALYALRHRLGYGWSYMHEALDRIVPNPARRRNTPEDLRRHRRRSALWFQFEIARTERSARKASRLAQQYPEWPEAVDLAKKLAALTD